MKPIFKNVNILGEEKENAKNSPNIDYNCLGVYCGKCGEMFGLMVCGNENDTTDLKYFKEHFNYCNKCGISVHWL